MRQPISFSSHDPRPALPLAVSAAGRLRRRVVFSRRRRLSPNRRRVGGETPKAASSRSSDGHLNQLTEDPTDTEPAFSADGRTIAFVRGGDIYSMRPDGSGQRQLTSGPELDAAAARLARTARYVVFERRAAAGAPRDLYTVGIDGGGPHALDHRRRRRARSRRSRPTAHDRLRPQRRSPAATADDLYSVRPSAPGCARLTHTGRVDEFAPRYFAGGIVFSRGESSEGPARLRRHLHDAPQRQQGASRWSAASARPTSKTSRPTATRCSSAATRASGSKRIGPGRARKLDRAPRRLGDQRASSPPTGARSPPSSRPTTQQSLVAIDVASRPPAPSSPKASRPPKKTGTRRSARSSPGSRCRLAAADRLASIEGPSLRRGALAPHAAV